MLRERLVEMGTNLGRRRDQANSFEGCREKHGRGGGHKNWLAVDWDHSRKRKEYLSVCKGLEARRGLVYLKNRRKASVTGTWQGRRREV